MKEWWKISFTTDLGSRSRRLLRFVDARWPDVAVGVVAQKGLASA